MQWLDNIAGRYRHLAPIILRLGIAVVFLLFGFHKLSVPSQGAAEVQLLLSLGIGSAAAINYYMGLIEMLVGILLLGGWQLRIAGLLAAVISFFIFVTILVKNGLSIDPNLYRDIGISAAGLVIFLFGKNENSTPQQ